MVRKSVAYQMEVEVNGDSKKKEILSSFCAIISVTLRVNKVMLQLDYVRVS